ncbi:hypothetical protein C8R47DRAFT_66232 [Mycena vitilis]|nr:hypothetical protein C8R47DRAFT_66232 [Mycena vitilis]
MAQHHSYRRMETPCNLVANQYTPRSKLSATRPFVYLQRSRVRFGVQVSFGARVYKDILSRNEYHASHSSVVYISLFCIYQLDSYATKSRWRARLHILQESMPRLSRFESDLTFGFFLLSFLFFSPRLFFFSPRNLFFGPGSCRCSSWSRAKSF